MKYKGTKEAIFQSFMFNFGILIAFIIGGLYYIYPQYVIAAEKKQDFLILSKNYTNLTQKGLTFVEFTNIHTSGSAPKTDNKDLLDSILTDFRENDYNEHFTHTGSVYKTFLDAKIIDAKSKREQQKVTDINSKIDEILPEYTSDSSLSETSLTDFKFVNHIENLLDTFELSTKDKIGIGNLVEFGKDSSSKPDDNIQLNTLDSTIYEGSLQLGLIGNKKNIINFIHYIENVGKIGVDEKAVSILEADKNRIILTEDGSRKKNNFLDITTYFNSDENPYNGLIMEIETLEFSEYLDSSEFPTTEGYGLIQWVKENQSQELFEINMKLKYYVKGLPTFKIEKFINDVQIRHAELSKIAMIGVAHTTKNRSDLKSTQAISAIGSLSKVNSYLLEVQKELITMKKGFAQKEDLGSVYKTAQEFGSVFEIIADKLSVDLKAISETLYDSNKEVLNKINQ